MRWHANDPPTSSTHPWQVAAEIEKCADSIRQLHGEAAKARQEAREEADTLAAAVRAGQAVTAEGKDTIERALCSIRAEVKELRDGADAASG